MRRTTTLFALFAVAALACGKDEPPPPKGSPPPAGQDDPVAQARQDAEFLGKDLFVMMDQVMGYKSSHRGQLPRSLRQMGADSLTPATERRLSIAGALPQVTILYRRTQGRQVLSCQGTSDLIEEALLNSGEFTTRCVRPGGVAQPFKVGRRPPPKD